LAVDLPVKDGQHLALAENRNLQAAQNLACPMEGYQMGWWAAAVVLFQAA
jgi:hypothetical protein